MELKTKGRTYTITRDSNGWSLDSPITVTSPKGVERLGQKTTYHGTCGQTLAYIADLELGGAKDVNELTETVRRLSTDLLNVTEVQQQVTRLKRKAR